MAESKAVETEALAAAALAGFDGMPAAPSYKKLKLKGDAEGESPTPFNRFTKEQWKALSPKQQWDITVAMRGPDMVNGEVLKWFTTGVLRAVMEGIIRPEGGSATMNRALPFVTVTVGGFPYAGPTKGVRVFNAQHFLQHVIEAAELTQTPTVMLPPTTFWSVVGHSHPHQGVEQIVEWLSMAAQAGDDHAKAMHKAAREALMRGLV